MKSLFTRFLVFSCTLLVAGAAFAQDGAAMGTESYKALAAGIGIGLAVLGGGMGQGRAAAAAFEGLSRNPNARDAVFVPFILGLALIESLVILALVGLKFI